MRSSLMWIVKGLFFYVRAFDLNSKEIVRGIGEGISKIVSFVLRRTLFRFGFSEYVLSCFVYIYLFCFDLLCYNLNKFLYVILIILSNTIGPETRREAIMQPKTKASNSTSNNKSKSYSKQVRTLMISVNPYL